MSSAYLSLFAVSILLDVVDRGESKRQADDECFEASTDEALKNAVALPVRLFVSAISCRHHQKGPVTSWFGRAGRNCGEIGRI